MVDINHYTAVGYALELLALSKYHNKFSMMDYMHEQILPPLSANQVKFYLADDATPIAMVTWAWISEDIRDEIHETGRSIIGEEWYCGNHLFCNDWITPYNNIREVTLDMSKNVFPDQIASSIRRNPDGSVRRVNRWAGKNVRISKGKP
ncbi:MAG: toxin-activating lysine-acyltransferase [Rhizobiales bacterium]|nr:toxin-activating lysine-acyltransferase [Hyphomicrobiales bacterium]